MDIAKALAHHFKHHIVLLLQLLLFSGHFKKKSAMP